MKIGIIGGGFSGLALSYHLLNLLPGSEITIFDKGGIGSGASGVAAGLLHPYPGPEAKLSWKANEGMENARGLLEIASKEIGRKVYRDGLVRVALKEAQQKQFIEMRKEPVLEGPEKEIISPCEGYFFEEGMTVFTEPYIEGLWRHLEKKGVKGEEKRIEKWEELKGFDRKIFAGGAEALAFPLVRDLPLKGLKGQVLVCRLKEGSPMPRHSILGDGYISITETPGIIILGSTYERSYSHEGPELEEAVKSIFSKKMPAFFEKGQLSILEARAGIRVANRSHYFPFVGEVAFHRYVITGMGSRGLLYHGLVGKYLAEAIAKEDCKAIPEQVRVSF